MNIVGKGIAKIDGMSIATGKPVYTDDLAAKEALVVKILRKSSSLCNYRRNRYKKSINGAWSRMYINVQRCTK